MLKQTHQPVAMRAGPASAIPTPAISATRLPPWMRPSLVFLFVATLFFNVWGLDRNGGVNAWYSAAVGAGVRRWKARRLPNSAAP